MVRNMRKERLMQLIMFVGLILLIIISFLIGIVFGQFYMLFFFVFIVCGIFFILIELYLRVQHNINYSTHRACIISSNSNDSFETKLNQIDSKFNEILFAIHSKLDESKSFLTNKFEEQKKIYEEIVDFFETMLEYLENEKSERESERESEKSERESDKNEIKKELESLEDIKNIQSKLTIIMRQILDYEREQTNFLNEKISKSKNASSRKRK